jgi:hypothetical protein
MAADATSATVLDDGQFGWIDLSIDEAVERGTAVEQLREARDLRFATDLRPHSHPYLMMAQVRATETESGTIDVGESKTLHGTPPSRDLRIDFFFAT